MKYVPKLLTENHNVPKTKSEVDFIILVAGFFALLFALYISMIIAGWITVKFFPDTAESMLAEMYDFKQDKRYVGQQKKLQKLLDLTWNQVDPKIKAKLGKPKIIVEHCDIPNAHAAPGNVIAFCNNLITELNSDKAVAMIIGHEIGHLKNHDSLNRLGSRLFLFGTKYVVAKLIDIELDLFFQGGILSTLKHSRDQESKADVFGLELLVGAYGEASGALKAFEAIGKLEKRYKKSDSAELSIFHSHPMSKDRRDHMAKLIKERGYRVALH